MTTTKKSGSKSAGSAKKAQGFEGVEKIVSQNKAKFERLTQDATAVGQEQMEAFVQSGTIFAKGLEGFAKTYAALAQESAERNAQAFKTLMGAKTLNEFSELNNRLAQQNLDDFMNGFTRLSEIGVKLATEAFEPINDQVNKSIRKASEAIAA